jgi:hypothetical protein
MCEILFVLPIAMAVLDGFYFHLAVEGKYCHCRQTAHGQVLLNTEPATAELCFSICLN